MSAAGHDLRGVLLIGDPHLAHRAIGYRSDDYGAAILAKLAWALELARRERLLPALLGDLFHWPRDNANALLVELLRVLGGWGGGAVPMIAGNHDMRYHPLGDDDTLAILETAGAVRVVDRAPQSEWGGAWAGTMGGRRVVLGGTSWGGALPSEAPALPESWGSAPHDDRPPLVLWMTHGDHLFPGYAKAGARPPREIPGVDIAINGHIHHPCAPVRAGATTWFNPGNIARITRSIATRERRPSVLRIDIGIHAGGIHAGGIHAGGEDAAAKEAEVGWRATTIEVPHRPFAEVFHDPELAVAVDPGEGDLGESPFVRGLEQLLARRTASGQGLRDFLAANVGQFDNAVAAEVRELAEEVLGEEAGA